MSGSGGSEQTVALADMYDPPITIEELQDKLFYAPIEQPGPTPPRDEEIYSLVYGHLKKNEARVSDERRGSFAPKSGGGWICVGREIGKLLSVLPDTSLSDLMDVAKENGFEAEVVR